MPRKINSNINSTAFPSIHSTTIERMNRKISFLSLFPHSNLYKVYLNDEQLSIPYRIYHDEPHHTIIQQLEQQQKAIFACFYTRHCDGFVREQMLRYIIKLDDAFVVPYVIQLTGEYVYEILEVIYDHLEDLNIDSYLNFIFENPVYFAKTKARMISYWDCYYRNRATDLKHYKGYKIFEYFENKLKQRQHV